MRKFYIYIGEAENEADALKRLEDLSGMNDGSEILANATPIFEIPTQE